jgi:hypothetical protein
MLAGGVERGERIAAAEFVDGFHFVQPILPAIRNEKA